MLIDWFTVIAQIVNFLILVALLKRFLWGRLVRAIDEREKGIALRLADADEKNKDAERQVVQAHSRTIELEQKREQMIGEAQHEADEQRNEIIQKARDEVRKLEARWRDDLRREQDVFLEDVRRRAATGMLASIRRALADLAGSDIQHCATQVFLEKIRTLDAAALRDLVGRELTVLSPGELADATRGEIQAVLESRLGAGIHLRFERAPAMAWGIELRGNGRRIGWTPASYVESLEENLKQALEHRAEVVTQ